MVDSNGTAILAQFRAELGEDESTADEGSTIELVFENGGEVTVTRDDAGFRIVIESDLGPWPAADARLLSLLLKNNYVWTDLALQFSIRPADDNLIAARCLDSRTLTLESLKAAIAALMQSVETWKRVLSQGANEGAVTPARDDVLPLNSIRI